MVCPRCVDAVSSILNEMNLDAESVELGEIVLTRKVKSDQLKELENRLEMKGFELVLDRESEITVQIKTTLIHYLNHLEKEKNPKKISVFLSSQLNYNYSYLSNLFSVHEKITIESFFIRLKVERVKELLSYKKWTLSEIAWKLKYSSVQYLSNQFKKITGQTVTEYLNNPQSKRIPLDQL